MVCYLYRGRCPRLLFSSALQAPERLRSTYTVIYLQAAERSVPATCLVMGGYQVPVSEFGLEMHEARNIDDVARLMPFVGAQDRSRTCTPLDTRT